MEGFKIDLTLNINLSNDTKSFLSELFSNFIKNNESKTEFEFNSVSQEKQDSFVFKGDYILLAENKEISEKFIINHIGAIDTENNEKAQLTLGKLKKGNRIFVTI